MSRRFDNRNLRTIYFLSQPQCNTDFISFFLLAGRKKVTNPTPKIDAKQLVDEEEQAKLAEVIFFFICQFFYAAGFLFLFRNRKNEYFRRYCPNFIACHITMKISKLKPAHQVF